MTQTAAPLYPHYPQYVQPPRPRLPWWTWVVLVITVLIGSAMVSAATTVIIGPREQPSQPVAAAPPGPTPAEVSAATVNLCTGWATAYAALPAPQTSAADMLPGANYVSDALRMNPAADRDIRDAVVADLELWRAHAAAWSHERAVGAIQPGPKVSQADADAANAADDRVRELCESYQP